MELTAEQLSIIHSTGNIKINAVAGSGKTTTIIEYAKARPKTAKMLYLAFNKSVKLEAQKKFLALGLDNVQVETAHSLAFKHIVRRHNYKVKSQGYKTHEIAELLNLKGNGEKNTEYVVATHINKFVTYFCNSDKQTVQELNYLDTISDAKAKQFVTTFYAYIEQQTRLFLGKMNNGEIDVTHDFYLKKFQLSNPTLYYEYIFFDEGHDASPVMLDVFFRQKATRVIVGDTHQQIYGWRYAVNSLEKADYANYNLSTSFRFSQHIANLAMAVLQWKSHINETSEINIIGKGSTNSNQSKAVIARTNLGLLMKAIEYVTEKKKVRKVYFEGNIHSYTYADDGTSLYDILYLYNSEYHLIKDKLIKKMKSLNELEDYIEKTEEIQLGMLVEIVKEYGNEIPHIIQAIKEKHVVDTEKDSADMVFSTVHRCKGMEYDAVELVNDFMTEEKLEMRIDGKEKINSKEKIINIDKLREEINLLYVAVTRTKNHLQIPETLMPKDFPFSSQINVILDLHEDDKAKPETAIPAPQPAIKDEPATDKKTFSVEQVREKYRDAYKPWTEDLDNELTVMYCESKSIPEMATHFGRTKGAIHSRIRKLELEALYD